LGWNQSQYDANVTSALLPSGCYLYGGASDTVAEDMTGKHLPSTTGVVRADPNANPISVWLNPDTSAPFQAATITTDARGVLPVFAVPGGVAPMWADFGQGSVAVKPWDTDKRLVGHANAADPHGSKLYTDQQIAVVTAKSFFQIKPADTIVNGNATPANDPHLVTGTLPANSTWTFRAYLKYASASTAADLKITLAYPVGAVGDWVPVGLDAASTAASGSIFMQSTVNASRNVGALVVGTNAVALMQGVVIIGATAGQVALQWAQGTLTPENTTLFTNSHWKWFRES
jgi:hypothetical protein